MRFVFILILLEFLSILRWSFASMFLSYFHSVSWKKSSLSGLRQIRSPHLLSSCLLLCDGPHGGVNPPAAGPSHVVSHIYGVQLVGQESVSEVHALLLPSGVDRDDAGVDHHHHPYDEVVLLQDNVGDQGHQVQGLLLRSLQLHNHHQEVCPCEHGTGGRKMNIGEEKWKGWRIKRVKLGVRYHVAQLYFEIKMMSYYDNIMNTLNTEQC